MSDFLRKQIAELRAENEKLRAALKRLHDAGTSISADELPWSILDWWNKELAAAAAAYRETGDEA